jgi:hypothetical protein
MNSVQLQSNEDLYHYLRWLADELQRRGKPDVSQEVAWASQFAVGSPTEFFHEAMKVLASVAVRCRGSLTNAQLEDVESVFDQIRKAFERIGGA